MDTTSKLNNLDFQTLSDQEEIKFPDANHEETPVSKFESLKNELVFDDQIDDNGELEIFKSKQKSIKLRLHEISEIFSEGFTSTIEIHRNKVKALNQNIAELKKQIELSESKLFKFSRDFQNYRDASSAETQKMQEAHRIEYESLNRINLDLTKQIQNLLKENAEFSAKIAELNQLIVEQKKNREVAFDFLNECFENKITELNRQFEEAKTIGKAEQQKLIANLQSEHANLVHSIESEMAKAKEEFESIIGSLEEQILENEQVYLAEKTQLTEQIENLRGQVVKFDADLLVACQIEKKLITELQNMTDKYDSQVHLTKKLNIELERASQAYDDLLYCKLQLEQQKENEKLDYERRLNELQITLDEEKKAHHDIQVKWANEIKLSEELRLNLSNEVLINVELQEKLNFQLAAKSQLGESLNRQFLVSNELEDKLNKQFLVSNELEDKLNKQFMVNNDLQNKFNKQFEVNNDLAVELKKISENFIELEKTKANEQFHLETLEKYCGELFEKTFSKSTQRELQLFIELKGLANANSLNLIERVHSKFEFLISKYKSEKNENTKLVDLARAAGSGFDSQEQEIQFYQETIEQRDVSIKDHEEEFKNLIIEKADLKNYIFELENKFNDAHSIAIEHQLQRLKLQVKLEDIEGAKGNYRRLNENLKLAYEHKINNLDTTYKSEKVAHENQLMGLQNDIKALNAKVNGLKHNGLETLGDYLEFTEMQIAELENEMKSSSILSINSADSQMEVLMNQRNLLKNLIAVKSRKQN